MLTKYQKLMFYWLRVCVRFLLRAKTYISQVVFNCIIFGYLKYGDIMLLYTLEHIPSPPHYSCLKSSTGLLEMLSVFIIFVL